MLGLDKLSNGKTGAAELDTQIEHIWEEQFVPADEKNLLWKCDIHLLPPLFVLFLMAFLDRSNIGMILAVYRTRFRIWHRNHVLLTHDIQAMRRFRV